MNTIRTVTDANEYRQVERKIAEFETQAKFRIRKGLLESLSGEIIYYTLPAGIMPQSPQGGMAFIAKLKDLALFEKTMAGVEEFAVANSNNMLQVSSKETDGRTMHIWAVMPLAVAQIMPSWTIVDGYFVVSTNTALCDLAAAQILSRDNSLRKTDEYAKGVGKLPEKLMSVRYTNSKLQFSQTMTGLQQFWPMATMVAAQKGVKLPFILPNLTPIIDEMEPSCGYAWSDSDGFYSHYRGTGIEPSLGSIGGTAFVLGITMPALAKTRQISYQLVSGANLSVIGKACMVYARDNDEKFPDTLEQLIETADLPAKCLVSKFKPKTSSEPSYIYIAGQDTTMDTRNILAHENPEFSRSEINVLFLDGHVEKMDIEEFQLARQATYNRLRRENAQK
jgi:prepilin-type processing-associated H-X9-DG protein